MHQDLPIPFGSQRPSFPDPHHLDMKASGQLPIHRFDQSTHAIAKLVKSKRWSVGHIPPKRGLEQNPPGIVQALLFVNVDKPFVPKDASRAGHTTQQMVEQVAVMRAGWQNGSREDHAGTCRDPQTSFEPKIVPLFRRTIPIRGLEHYIITKDLPRRRPTEMAHRHGEGVNHLHRIVPGSTLTDNHLPDFVFDSPQILPLAHQGTAIRQVRKPGAIVFAKIPVDLFVGLFTQILCHKLDRQRLFIRQRWRKLLFT